MVALSQFLEAIAEWAESRPDIIGVALVGSHARASANPDSDIDLVVVTTTADDYRTDSGWILAIHWPAQAGRVRSWRDAEYGKIWSRHLSFADGSEVELSFTSPDWAETAPMDPGTRQVISNGCRILWDPQATLRHLVAALSTGV